MSENQLPRCFNCGGPVHGGPCCLATQHAPACQACLYRAAQSNGLCHNCERREQVADALACGGPTLLRFAAAEIKATDPFYGKWKIVTAEWLEGLADRWSHNATGDEMDAGEAIARAYFKVGQVTRRCPCFLHYHPPRKWWHLTCACECDHQGDPGQ